MVTAITGAYSLFTDAGLSTATIQRQTITDEQISTLFWINILVGTVLALLCLITAPVIVRFYDEPRLFWITVISAGGFIINAAGVQHFALLERQLRFVAVTVIERFAQLVGVIVAIIMAVRPALAIGHSWRRRLSHRQCATLLRLVDHVLDPRPSASRSWHQIDASIRRNGHLERIGRIRRL